MIPEGAHEQLLSCNADIATGVYLCNQEVNGKMVILPTLYVPFSDDEARVLSVKEIVPDKVIGISACGLGCCLIKRGVLEKAAFRHLTDSSTGGEDMAFCLDAAQAGVLLKAITAVKCDHLSPQRVVLRVPSKE
ncbi:TPA: hypothetical protein HA296_03120 [Candidatus Woesearchaeota archaeon]|nr:hypothetical protein [Candidatus Woesearchaeota archaeon]